MVVLFFSRYSSRAYVSLQQPCSSTLSPLGYYEIKSDASRVALLTLPFELRPHHRTPPNELGHVRGVLSPVT